MFNSRFIKHLLFMRMNKKMCRHHLIGSLWIFRHDTMISSSFPALLFLVFSLNLSFTLSFTFFFYFYSFVSFTLYHIRIYILSALCDLFQAIFSIHKSEFCAKLNTLYLFRAFLVIWGSSFVLFQLVSA